MPLPSLGNNAISLVKNHVLGDISMSSKIVIPECYCRVEDQSISHGVDVGYIEIMD